MAPAMAGDGEDDGGGSNSRTAKTPRYKRVIDCTRGISRAQRAINRRNRIESSSISRSDDDDRSRPMKEMLKLQKILAAGRDAYEKQCAVLEERFGRLPDRVVLDSTFEEKPFGYPLPRDIPYLSSIVVSFALFDGDKMLLACSGIPLPRGTTQLHLTRFVTSARLVREFNDNRNRDDELRIEVRLPDNTITDGFLGLYDEDIAIVTSLGLLADCPDDLDLQETLEFPAPPILAAGRAFKSGSLMATQGLISRNTYVSDSQDLTVAALGGPLMGEGMRFLGMNLDLCHHGDVTVNVRSTSFLPQKLLRERLDHFQILKPEKLHFRGYSLPSGVSSIVPSGFWRAINELKSFGYPMPPPLVLEFNGVLLNDFEETFGELRAWKGYPFCNPGKEYTLSGDPPIRLKDCVWERLEKNVFTDMSRRVVSLASFKGYVRSFACTCLLIKWHGVGATRTVVLTSASLVRNCNDEVTVDYNLRIEVFLPPNQRSNGILEFCDLDYNIAVVSLQKNFHAVRPEDIFDKVEKPSKEVVAIGRETEEGLLMASIGEVKGSNKDNKLDCKDLKLSTCKIKKAGIGGPLINFDGSFVGMNFYDGSGVTPFLPKSKIVEVFSRACYFPLILENFRSIATPDNLGTGGYRSSFFRNTGSSGTLGYRSSF